MSLLGERSTVWDCLVDAAHPPSPFLRSWWLDAVTVTGAQVAHLLVERDGELIGGVPLVRDRLLGIPRYRFAGHGVLCPDHLDVIALAGCEEAVETAVRAWFTAPGQRLIDLAGLTQDSRLAGCLGIVSQPIDNAPYQPLSGCDPDYLATRSSNFRRATRKAERRLTEDGVSQRRATVGSLPVDLESFRRLSGDREGRGPFLAELSRLERALAAGLQRGEARVDVLESGSEAVAVSVAFEVAGRLSLYQVARSLEQRYASAATVLMTRLIAEGVDAGIVEVDMLRGGEGYKASFVDATRSIHRLRAGHGAAARVVVAGWELLTQARAYAVRLRARVSRSR